MAPYLPLGRGIGLNFEDSIYESLRLSILVHACLFLFFLSTLDRFFGVFVFALVTESAANFLFFKKFCFCCFSLMLDSFCNEAIAKITRF